MKKLVLLFLFLPFLVQGHPGIGIVKDSKGNIFYTDLKQVWKISKGKRVIVIPEVHTHELHIDQHDNLYGEGGYYDAKSEKFFHYMWVYRPNGKLDSIVKMKEAYVQHDFALAKDKEGNEFYLKRFLVSSSDTTHLYKKTPGEKEIIYATGDFKDVNWLHPQDDGSLLYVSKNAIYKVDNNGKIHLIADKIANNPPTQKLWNNVLIWGVWLDKAGNTYAAVLSERAVKKIDKQGKITEIYKSPGNWSPLQGVFDNDNNLWVLENSDKNEVRVQKVSLSVNSAIKSDISKPFIFWGVISIALVLFLFTKQRKKQPDGEFRDLKY